jgi:hypothetical protein
MITPTISREQMHAYLDDALNEAETAQIERLLRESEELRQALRLVMQERDRGEHSLGAIWRRERLTCPSREQLGSYLLEVLDDAEMTYYRFHLETIACPYCVANLADLQARQQQSDSHVKERQKRIARAGANLLQSRHGKPPGGQ